MPAYQDTYTPVCLEDLTAKKLEGDLDEAILQEFLNLVPCDAVMARAPDAYTCRVDGVDDSVSPTRLCTCIDLYHNMLPLSMR